MATDVLAEIDKYTAALAADPKSRAFAPLAEAYRKQGKIDEALKVVTDGLKIHTNLPGALVTYARCLIAQGKFSEARPHLERAIKLAPENLTALSALGDTLEKLGDSAAAVKSFRTVLLLSPADAHAKERLAALGSTGTSPAEKGRADAFQVKPAADALRPVPPLEASPAVPVSIPAVASAVSPPAAVPAPAAPAPTPTPAAAPTPAAIPTAAATPTPTASAPPPASAPASPLTAAAAPAASPAPAASASAVPPAPAAASAPAAPPTPPASAPASPPAPAAASMPAAARTPAATLRPAATPGPATTQAPAVSTAGSPAKAAATPAVTGRAPSAPTPVIQIRSAPSPAKPLAPPGTKPAVAQVSGPAASKPAGIPPKPLGAPPAASIPARPAGPAQASAASPMEIRSVSKPVAPVARQTVPSPRAPTAVSSATETKVPLAAAADRVMPAAPMLASTTAWGGEESSSPSPVPTGLAPIQTVTVADLFVKQGHPEQAVAIYEKLVGEDPGNEALRKKLADARAPRTSTSVGPVPEASLPPGDTPEEFVVPPLDPLAALETALHLLEANRRGPSPQPRLRGGM